MTVNNIINMAMLNQLDIIALTDHNSSKNCPAFAEIAKQQNMNVLLGMELTTREEVHVICLFETLEKAMNFDEYVYSKLPDIKNNIELFGNQYILDIKDNIIGEESKLLINATDIGTDELPALIKQFEGHCFPAHIDKDSFSMINTLGFLTLDMGFSVAEIKELSNREKFIKSRQLDENITMLQNSDAHYLWDIGEKTHYFENFLALYKNI